MGREPPIAEPLDRWCGGWELKTPGYPIKCDLWHDASMLKIARQHKMLVIELALQNTALPATRFEYTQFYRERRLQPPRKKQRLSR